VAAPVCAACGVQTAGDPPAVCPICADERQYVGVGGHGGQQWLTVESLAVDHHNVVGEEEPGLYGLVTRPHFGIGQRALLVQGPDGGLLWDCVSLVDDHAVQALEVLGGAAAVALSHPHFYASCVQWSEVLGGVPIYVHEDDATWVQRPSDRYRFWSGDEVEPVPGVRLLHLGGHFPGSAVAHWPGGADGAGVLLSSDTVQVVPDRRHVSVMWSYPNQVPVSRATLEAMAGRLARVAYDRIYGAFPGTVVRRGAEAAVARSFRRYAEHLRDDRR
jgi:glyoxylase-like metal-dependent hydrolase (beta-lactamase superfamily II)